MRQAELYAAADRLGVKEVVFLDYMDGDLDHADSAEVIDKLAAHIRRIRPQVVVTFDPNGAYGHPDHIAISQFTTAAIVSAAAPNGGAAPHQVSKLYFRGFSAAEMAAYEAAFGDLVMNIDGVERRSTAWPAWAFTSRVDTSAYWQQVWQAIECHRSQVPGYESLKRLPDEYHQHLWKEQTFYRVFSLVNGGREIEQDLFAGLRVPLLVEGVYWQLFAPHNSRML